MSGIADTAKLLASLDLQDTMTPKLRTAIGGVSAAENRIGALSSKVSAFASNLGGGASRAVAHFTGQLGNLARYGAAALGLGGFLGIGAVVEGSISKLEEFSLALEKVQTLTGETARDSGTLILLFEKFGISLDQVGTFAGFAEKTLGKLNNATTASTKATKSAALAELERQRLERQAAGLSTKKIDVLIREQKATDALNASLSNAADGTTKLQALDKQYGLALIDASGKTVSFSGELLQLADFYDRNHDAAQRAYVASTLLGRGYATLSPILDQGSAAIREAAAEADALGLGSQNTADQLVAFRSQMRDLGVQANVLQLKIGMALIPVVSHFATDLSAFITAHGTDIAAFFSNAGREAEHLAGTVADLAGTIGDWWGKLPAPLRDLMTSSFAGDRVIKFAFGFSPIGSIFSGIEKAIGSAVAGGVAKGAITAGLGKLFVQPVFVTNPGFGGIGGAAADAGEVAGGAAAGVGAVAVAISALAIPIAIGVANLLKNAAGITDEQQQYLNTHGQFGNRSLGNPSYSGYAGRITPPAVPFHDSAEGHAADTVASALIQFRADERASLTATAALTSVMRDAPWLSKLEDSWRKAGQTMHDKITEAIKGLTGPHAGLAAAFLGGHLGQAGFGAGGIKQAEQVIAALKELHSSDPAVIHAINRLTAQLPRLKTDAKDLAAAEKVAQSTDPKNTKLDELNRIMADLRAHGDRTTRAKVSDLIAAVKKQKVTVVAPINIRVPGARSEAGSTVHRIVTRSGTAVAT